MKFHAARKQRQHEAYQKRDFRQFRKAMRSTEARAAEPRHPTNMRDAWRSLAAPELLNSMTYRKAQTPPFERDLWTDAQTQRYLGPKDMPWLHMTDGHMQQTLRFYKTTAALAGREGIPLFPADYHGDSVDIRHLLLGDDLNALQMQVLDQIATTAADALRLTYDRRATWFETHRREKRAEVHP